ncbi:MAG: hypothetical protein ABII26_04110, partial [Pseudomonadota bacterium]
MKKIALKEESEVKMGYYQYSSKLYPHIPYIFYDTDANQLINNYPIERDDAKAFEVPALYRGQGLENRSLLYFAIGTFKGLFLDLHVLHFLERGYPSATIDVVTHIDLFILLQQFGFRGGWSRYPIPSEFAEKYDYVFSNETLINDLWDSGKRVLERYRSVLPPDFEFQPMRFSPNMLLTRKNGRGNPEKCKVVIHINGERPINNYPLARYRRLIQLLGSENIQVMVTGFPCMTHALEGVAFENYVCKHRSIQEMLSLLWQSDLIITSDTFAARAASIFQKPTIVLLNTDDGGGYSWHSSVKVMSPEADCAPCYRFDKCPFGHT